MGAGNKLWFSCLQGEHFTDSHPCLAFLNAMLLSGKALKTAQVPAAPNTHCAAYTAHGGRERKQWAELPGKVEA